MRNPLTGFAKDNLPDPAQGISLIDEEKFPVTLRRCPVLLRREFRRKSLNSLLTSALKSNLMR